MSVCVFNLTKNLRTILMDTCLAFFSVFFSFNSTWTYYTWTINVVVVIHQIFAIHTHTQKDIQKKIEWLEMLRLMYLCIPVCVCVWVCDNILCGSAWVCILKFFPYNQHCYWPTFKKKKKKNWLPADIFHSLNW